jgi:hypothetical protein
MNKFLIIIASLIIFSGCARTTISNTAISHHENIPVMSHLVDMQTGAKYIIAGNSLEHLLQSYFSEDAQIIINDSSYSIVNLEWMAQVFGPHFKRYITGLEYSNTFDCDDFTRLCLLQLQVSHSNSGTIIQAPLLGEVHYVDSVDEETGKQNLHSLVMYVGLDTRNNNIIFLFFEPIRSSFIPLSREQIDSIYFINF